MAGNRFTNIHKWDNPRFRKMDLTIKLVLLFIKDRCDLTGFWQLDKETLIHYLHNTTIDQVQTSLNFLDGNEIVIQNGYVAVVGFIKEQFPRLKNFNPFGKVKEDGTKGNPNSFHVGLLRCLIENNNRIKDKKISDGFKPFEKEIKLEIGETRIQNNDSTLTQERVIGLGEGLRKEIAFGLGSVNGKDTVKETEEEDDDLPF